jgi:hypothetical protein
MPSFFGVSIFGIDFLGLFTSVCVLADFLVCLFWVADLIFAILGLFMLSFPGI